jgi:hypothetical protein
VSLRGYLAVPILARPAASVRRVWCLRQPRRPEREVHLADI